MVVLIVVAIAFYQAAKARGLQAILWAVVGGASYFAGQFLGVFVMGIIDINMLDDQWAIIGVGIFSGLVGVGIAYYALTQAANKVKSKQSTEKDNLLDDGL